MPEDMFDMSNVRIFQEIEKKKMGDAYTLLCLWSAELSRAFGLRNLRMLFQTSRVKGCWNLAKTRVRMKNKMPCAQMLHI